MARADFLRQPGRNPDDALYFSDPEDAVEWLAVQLDDVRRLLHGIRLAATAIAVEGEEIDAGDGDVDEEQMTCTLCGNISVQLEHVADEYLCPRCAAKAVLA